MNKKLLIIGLVWPEPTSSAAGARMLQLIRQFQHQGFDITFACAAKSSERSFDLSSINIRPSVIALNDPSFDVFISDLNPEVVMFDRFMIEEQFGWRVAEQCPDALRILNTEDLHGLRKGREMALRKGEPFGLDHLHNDTTKREVASIYRCDLSLMISETEIELLTDQLKVNPSLLFYIPFLIDLDTEVKALDIPIYDERQHFVTIGNFRHPPNYDALEVLYKDIWPELHKHLPQSELHVYGAYPSDKVMQYHSPEHGFWVKGVAESVDEVMQKARVCLAPLRFGAGLKGKLVDAMRNGTPCVMTPIAAEGLFGSLEPNGSILEITDDFCVHAAELYKNKILWEEKSQHGFKILKERFNRIAFQQSMAEHIETLLQTLKVHRQNNFMGQVLYHKTLQSSKYMSKWIEAKNKKMD